MQAMSALRKKNIPHGAEPHKARIQIRPVRFQNAAQLLTDHAIAFRMKYQKCDGVLLDIFSVPCYNHAKRKPAFGSGVSKRTERESMRKLFSYDEIIRFLEQRDFSEFCFDGDYGRITADRDPAEISIEAPGGVITDEMAELAVSALRQIEKCLESGYQWLERFKDTGSEAMEPLGICFEHYGYGYESRTSYELGFTIAFHFKHAVLNRIFAAKYFARTFWYGGAFAMEEYYG